jgi:hypothetical protein
MNLKEERGKGNKAKKKKGMDVKTLIMILSIL